MPSYKISATFDFDTEANTWTLDTVQNFFQQALREYGGRNILTNVTCTFSASMVTKFWEAFTGGKYQGQRIGQAFYNAFDLHKVVSDKAGLDKLYEMDDEVAAAWIASHTNYEA